MKPLIIFIFAIFSITNSQSQIPNYSVYALRFCELTSPIPLSALVKNAPEKETIEAIFMIWLIKGDNGKNILVDAGFINGIEEAKDWQLKNYIRPDSILSQVGL